jgi:hypothetical protein
VAVPEPEDQAKHGVYNAAKSRGTEELTSGLTAGSTGRTVLRTSLRVASQPGVMSIEYSGLTLIES